MTEAPKKHKKPVERRCCKSEPTSKSFTSFVTLNLSLGGFSSHMNTHADTRDVDG